MTRSIKSPVVLTLTVLLAVPLSTTANAQSDAVKQLYVTAANVNTNIEGGSATHDRLFIYSTDSRPTTQDPVAGL